EARPRGPRRTARGRPRQDRAAAPRGAHRRHGLARDLRRDRVLREGRVPAEDRRSVGCRVWLTPWARSPKRPSVVAARRGRKNLPPTFTTRIPCWGIV